LTTPLFITGIGTGVGKTPVSAVLTEVLLAHYWKPIQAGYADGTDAQWISGVVSNGQSVIYPELYKLALPASPHIAAREDGIQIEIARWSGYPKIASISKTGMPDKKFIPDHAATLKQKLLPLL
jgi:dethiobiotin synthetase